MVVKMENIHRRVLLVLVATFLVFSPVFSQNTSPLVVKDFVVKSIEIIDLDQIPKFNRTDLDNNPICRIKVKSVGFEENVLQKFIFVPNGLEITHMEFKNGQWYLHVSSRKSGEITIKYMGDCVFRLPYQLEPHKVYELTLGMETATLSINAIPSTAEIYIDSNKVGTGYGSASIAVGSEHRYKVVCDDYIPEENVVKTDKAEKIEKHVELKPNFGYITVKSDPSGADIYVDDVKVGITPYLMKKISLGDHVVEVRKTGYENYADMVTIKVRETNKQLENVKLTAVRVPKGSLELTSNPTGAVITINGRQYGQTPKTLTDFEVGTYTVYFSKEGYQNLSQTVEVKDGKKETLAVTMTKTSVPQPPVATTATPATTTTAGNRTFTVNGVSFEMIEVKGGTFTMGCTSEQGGDCDSDEKPTHSVTLSDYYIGKFEVTQELWQAVMGNNPSRFMGNNHPVENVSWNDVQEFITKLNQKKGANFRLPTEAEWEYAARGGNKSKGYKYSGSNRIDDVAVYEVNSYNKGSNHPDYGTHAVGTKSPNELGIYDMSGNVWEWCQDWKGSYSSGSQTNPTGPSSGSGRVLRGGGWFHYAKYCRVSYRDYINPDSGTATSGSASSLSLSYTTTKSIILS